MAALHSHPRCLMRAEIHRTPGQKPACGLERQQKYKYCDGARSLLESAAMHTNDRDKERKTKKITDAEIRPWLLLVGFFHKHSKLEGIMKKTRFILSLITMLCLAGWAWLRKPYSPSQELEPIVLTAFDIHADRPAGGYALAEAAAGWRGVTASSYNPASGLLALAHTSSVTPRDLTSRLKVLTPRPVSIKSFPEPAGTSCPVPAAALA
ncbi:MAG: hypothetical protein KDC61_19465, partial [Saprospiraceae bacterium]|nr:hypothetical protein [Saprospiraceae bacterium]